MTSLKRDLPDMRHATLGLELKLFPHPSLRDGQRAMMRAVMQHPRVIIHAPTGSGKTSVILNTLIALMQQEQSRLLIVTRTRTQIYETILPTLLRIQNHYNRQWGTRRTKTIKELLTWCSFDPLDRHPPLPSQASRKDRRNNENPSRDDPTILTPRISHGLSKSDLLPPISQPTWAVLVRKADLCVKVGKTQQSSECRTCSWRRIPLPDSSTMTALARFLRDHALEQHATTNADYPTPDRMKQWLSPQGCPHHLMRTLLTTADIVITTHGFLTNRRNRRYLWQHVIKEKPNRWMAFIDEVHAIGPTIETTFPLSYMTLFKNIPALKPLHSALVPLLDLPEGRVPYDLVPSIEEQQILADVVHDATLQLQHSNQSHQTRLNDRLISSTPIKTNSPHATNLSSPVLTRIKTALRLARHLLAAETKYWVIENDEIVVLNPHPKEVFEFLSPFSRVVLASATYEPPHLLAAYHGTQDYHYHIQRGWYSGQHLVLLRHPLYTTKHEMRSPELYQRFTSVIQRLISGNQNHTLVLVPSREFGDHLMNAGLQVDYQEQIGTTITFLEEVARDPTPRTLLGILGGKLSEGIEVRDPQTGFTRLTLIIIVGLAYPPPTPVTEALLDIYTDLGYFPKIRRRLLLWMPMLHKVLQAMGRGIRQPNDFNCTVILDHRITKSLYLSKGPVFRRVEPLIHHVTTFLQRSQEQVNEILKLQAHLNK